MNDLIPPVAALSALVCLIASLYAASLYGRKRMLHLWTAFLMIYFFVLSGMAALHSAALSHISEYFAVALVSLFINMAAHAIADGYVMRMRLGSWYDQ